MANRANKGRTPLQKAVDDVLATAMALGHRMRFTTYEQGAKYDKLEWKFIRATRRLEKRSGKR